METVAERGVRMRWLEAVLIVLAAFVGVVYVAGLRQPEEHLVTRSAIIQAAPGAVWKRIGDIPAEPKWRRPIKSASAAAPQDGHPCYQEDDGVPLTLCVERTDGERLRVVSIADSKHRFTGTWTFVVQPGEVGVQDVRTTRLTIAEDATVTPPLWRGFLLFTGYDRTLRTYLNELSESFNGQKAQS